MGGTSAWTQEHDTAETLTLGNVVSLGAVAASLYWFDAEPRVLFFVFLLTTLAQLVQIHVFLGLARGRRAPRVGHLLLRCTRPPTPREETWAKSAATQENAAKNFFDFAFLWGALTLFAFILLHVNASKELDFEWGVFAEELALALGLTVIYVVENLFMRETPMDFEQPDMMNFHFSSRRYAVLAFAVLTGGAVVVWLQVTGRNVSAWALTAPLLLWKHGFDLPSGRDVPNDRRKIPG